MNHHQPPTILHTGTTHGPLAGVVDRGLSGESLAANGGTCSELDIALLDPPGHLRRLHTPFKKKAIPKSIRVSLAKLHNVNPGESLPASCEKCGFTGYITWFLRQNGTPSGWVHFMDLEMDHIWPESKGGLCTIENIRLLCRKCNRSKGSKIENVK